MRQAGFKLQAQFLRIEYHQPALLGDEMAISLWCSDVQETTTSFSYQIQRDDGQILIWAESTWAWVNLETVQASSIPESFATVLRKTCK